MGLAEQMEAKLRARFLPSYCKLVNESQQHQSGKRNAEAETHFKLIMVSSHFIGLKLVHRHQKVYDVLAGFMSGSLHALSLHLFTPAEWTQSVSASPACAHSANDEISE